MIFVLKCQMVISIHSINDAAMISNSEFVNNKKFQVYLDWHVLFLKFCYYQVNRDDRLTRLCVYHEHGFPLLFINHVASCVYTVLFCVNPTL